MATNLAARPSLFCR